jgi:hypothetical protein
MQYYQKALVASGVAALCVSAPSSPFADPVLTKFSGYVYVVDDNREPVRYPWPIERIERHLLVKFYDFEEARREVAGPEIPSVSSERDPDLGEVAYYTLKIGDKLDEPMTVRIEFEHGRYFGRADRRLIGHTGGERVNVEIQRKFLNRDEQYRAIHEFFASESIMASEADETYRAIGALIREDPSLQHYFLLKDFIGAVLRANGYIDPHHANSLTYLDITDEFQSLALNEQVKVLSALAFVLARAPAPEATIVPGTNYLQFAQEFHNTAIALARRDPRGVDASMLAQSFQEKYKYECANGLWVDCFYTLFDFFQIANGEVGFNTATLRAILSDFSRELECLSIGAAPGACQTPLPYVEPVSRIAEDPRLVEFWSLYRDAATGARGAQTVVARVPHLRAARDRAVAIAERAAERALEEAPSTQDGVVQPGETG